MVSRNFVPACVFCLNPTRATQCAIPKERLFFRHWLNARDQVHAVAISFQKKKCQQAYPVRRVILIVSPVSRLAQKLLQAPMHLRQSASTQRGHVRSNVLSWLFPSIRASPWAKQRRQFREGREAAPRTQGEDQHSEHSHGTLACHKKTCGYVLAPLWSEAAAKEDWKSCKEGR